MPSQRGRKLHFAPDSEHTSEQKAEMAIIEAQYFDCMWEKQLLASFEKRSSIEAKLKQSKFAKSASAKTKAFNDAVALRRKFLERLKNFRVLDPACGSGNFLYLALKALKDFEFRVNFEAQELGWDQSCRSSDRNA